MCEKIERTIFNVTATVFKCVSSPPKYAGSLLIVCTMADDFTSNQKWKANKTCVVDMDGVEPVCHLRVYSVCTRDGDCKNKKLPNNPKVWFILGIVPETVAMG